MKTIIALALSVSMLAACAKSPDPAGLSYPDIAARDTISYLALGDSYTIGESVNQRSSFPFQLADSLRRQGVLINNLRVVAKTGWTTSDLKAALNQENIADTFDAVSLLIGVNNQYRGYSLETYRAEFIELLQTAIAFARGDVRKVFVISIPDWGATPFGGTGSNKEISAQIDQFNQINKEEAQKLHVNYSDITPVSREVIKNIALVAGDGLHPSEKMYSLWVHEIMQEFTKVF